MDKDNTKHFLTVSLDSLAKDRVQLLGDIVFLVRHLFTPQLDHNVRVRLAIQVHGVQVVCADHVHTHQHMYGVIGWQALG